MKRLFLLVLLSGFISVQLRSQCVPDLNITQPGIYPDSATGLASGVVGQPYNQVLQIKVPLDTQIVYQGINVTATIQNVELISYSGLPPGITYSCNPSNCIFPGGSNACALLSGTPTTAGIYIPTAVTKTTATIVIFGITIPLTQYDTVDYYVINIGITGMEEFRPFNVNLGQNSPNPATEKTLISFYVPENGPYSLAVFNLVGKEILRHNRVLKKGFHSVEINVTDFPPGIYMYSLSGNNTVLTRRMIVQKK